MRIRLLKAVRLPSLENKQSFVTPRPSSFALEGGRRDLGGQSRAQHGSVQPWYISDDPNLDPTQLCGAHPRVRWLGTCLGTALLRATVVPGREKLGFFAWPLKDLLFWRYVVCFALHKASARLAARRSGGACEQGAGRRGHSQQQPSLFDVPL